MGGFGSALIGGLIGGARGIRAGEEDRKVLEQQALRDALQERLLKFKVGGLQEAARRQNIRDQQLARLREQQPELGGLPDEEMANAAQTMATRVPTREPAPRAPTTMWAGNQLLQYDEETEVWKPALLAGADGGTVRKPEVVEEEDPAERFRQENALMDDYDDATKPWLNAYSALTRAQRHVPQALAGNAAAQVEMLYAFISTLDNSVVREGEMRLFGKAASLKDQALRHIERFGRAAAMPSQVIKEMAAILDDVSGDLDTRFGKIKQHYVGLGARYDIPADTFIDIPEMFGRKSKNADEPARTYSPNNRWAPKQ